MNSVLENIKNSINHLEWKSQTKKDKAINLCINIFNMYINDGGDFYSYRTLSKQYFNKVIRTKSYVYEIKNNLVNSGILEMDKSYDVKRKIAKGYRFNTQLIKGDFTLNNAALCSPTSETLEGLCDFNLDELYPTNNFTNYINNNNFNLYHTCGPTLETTITKGLEKIEFDTEVYTFINNYTINKSDIILNEDITEEFVTIKFDNGDYRYKLSKALELSKTLNKDLLQWNDKFYVEEVDNFIIRKTNDLKLIYRKSIFDIENGIFRISRNSTNNRLDYNLTNIKSELLNYIKVDGEPIIELDIANAQFAILSFITDNLDSKFIKRSTEGTLYREDNRKLNKKEWFRIAFDKVKKEQDKHREEYPITMRYIDNFKKKNGYKALSNLLQNTEALIMIDGVANRLIERNFDIFPIHDAIRVKESDVVNVKREMETFFNEIGFDCKLRIK